MKILKYLFLSVLLLWGLGCTPEERASLLNQLKNEEESGSGSQGGGPSTQDDTPEYPVSTLSGSFAFDDGTGLTTLYYSFINGKLYKYTITSPVVLAEGYLWHVSGDQFTLAQTDDFDVVDGILYIKGQPLGDVQVTNKKMTLAGQAYAKISGFKPQRYSVITIEGGLEQTCDYRQQTISIPVSLKRIPSGRLEVTYDAAWVRSAVWEGDVLMLTLSENNDGVSPYALHESQYTRSTTLTFSYPEAEEVVLTLSQTYAHSQIEFDTPGTVGSDGGDFSFDVTIQNPRLDAPLAAYPNVDWITDVVISGNRVSYKVAANYTELSRTGSIYIEYGSIHGPTATVQYASAQFDITQEGASYTTDSSAANCYIVSAPGAYSFKAVKGNSTHPVGNVASAEVLWESFGSDTAPSVGDIVSSVNYQAGSGSEPGTINFSTPSTLQNGNAVIAAMDAGGNILWSWHIWVCSGYDPVASAQIYYNNAGTMMDRNLGATSATPGNVGALGLLYQWGRKDPFLGSSSISSSTKAKSTLSTWPSAVSSNSSNGTIEYAVSHPTTFIGYNSSNYDWYYTGSSSTDNTRWQSSKTIYDPCPPGWRVPDGGSSGVWSKAVNSSSYFIYDWDSTNRGMNFSGKFGSADTIWYPAAGYLTNDGGSLYYVGSSGYWWSCTPSDSHAYLLFLYTYGDVLPSVSDYRAYGRSVRCLQE